MQHDIQNDEDRYHYREVSNDVAGSVGYWQKPRIQCHWSREEIDHAIDESCHKPIPPIRKLKPLETRGRQFGKLRLWRAVGIVVVHSGEMLNPLLFLDFHTIRRGNFCFDVET